MGLNFSHGDARWDYDGFNAFRRKLAREIGIDLYKMDGYGLDGQPWYEVEDALKPLLDHSDCDGALTPNECRSIAQRLLVLIQNWKDDDDDKLQGLMLANGMLLAAMAGENLRFC